MDEPSGWDVREQELIRLLGAWGQQDKAGMMAGMVELVLLGQAAAIIARERIQMSEGEWLAAMREAFSDG
jgi:hypothetical protein